MVHELLILISSNTLSDTCLLHAPLRNLHACQFSMVQCHVYILARHIDGRYRDNRLSASSYTVSSQPKMVGRHKRKSQPLTGSIDPI